MKVEVKMKTRQEIHAGFVIKFHTGKAAGQSDQQLDMIETALETKLPASYRSFMTTFGTVYTPRILDEISESELDHPDVQNIFDWHEAIAGTQGYWSAGMPDDLIGIASDCMGNMIGFRRLACRSDDAPVFFFDHDFVEVREIAPSFDAFLNWYLENLKGR